jgi:hypothetical protein
MKHYELLKLQMEKHETQQKVIERALESLEKSTELSPTLSKEEELWIRWTRDIKNGLIVMQKDIGILFMETVDIERFKKYIGKQKSLEFAFEYYYQKPLKECSLQEIIDGMVLTIRFQGGYDSLNCIEYSDHFSINVTHSMGLNVSKIIVIMHESLLKSYGAKFDVHYSERHIFFKINKSLEKS